MQDLFNRITQSAKDISEGVIGQTKATVNQGKVEFDLLQHKNDLKKLYTKLGEKVYQKELYQVEDPDIVMLHAEIADKNKIIQELEIEARHIRNDQKSTFESVKRNVKKTWEGEGTETRKPQPGEDGYLQMKFCPECNIGNHPEAEYCIACGCKQ